MSETSSSSSYGERSPADWWLNALMDPRAVDPQSLDQIVEKLMLTGELFTADYNRLNYHLDTIAPVRATYEITSAPRGFAPEAIRQQWIGCTLPVRGYFDPNEGVAVLAREALEILKEKSPEAHKWWQQYYAEEAKTRAPNVDPEGLPEFLANMSFLVFDLDCGTPRLLTNAPILNETRKIKDL